MWDDGLRALTLAAALTAMIGVGAAQPLSTTVDGVTASVPHTTYACTPGCTIDVTVTNDGDVNGTLDAFGVRAGIRGDARLTLSYRNRTGHLVEADAGRPGDTLTLPFDAFWNRTPDDPSSSSHEYHLRLDIAGNDGHGTASITPVINLTDRPAVRLPVSPALAALTALGPSNASSPEERRVTFRTRYGSPSRNTTACGIRYRGAVVAIRDAVRNASATTFTRSVPPDSPARWQAWCDWDGDNATTANELSATRWLTDTTPPRVTMTAPTTPVRFRHPAAQVALRATDAFTGTSTAGMAIEMDGTNYSVTRQPGTSRLRRFGETDTFNRSIDVSPFPEGEHRLWMWATDAAGNRRVTVRPMVIDLLTATPSTYWNRALGVNLSVASAAFVCAPRCMPMVRIAAPNGTLDDARLQSAFTPSTPAPNVTAAADHRTVMVSTDQGLAIGGFTSPDGATATVPVTLRGNTVPRRWEFTLSGGAITPTANRGPVAVSPWIDDIRLVDPANNTHPSNPLSFTFTYRSRRTSPSSCRVEYTGGTTDAVTARPGRPTTINATVSPDGDPPLRWRVACDVDADGAVADHEASTWRWFNDTTAPALTINFPREDGAEFRGDIVLGVSASDNLALDTVTATLTNTETGETAIDDRSMSVVGQGTYNETIVDGLAPGTYEVQFRATDAAGHTTRRTTTLTVPEKQGLLPDWIPSMDGGISIGGLIGVLVVIAVVLGIGGYAYLRSQVNY